MPTPDELDDLVNAVAPAPASLNEEEMQFVTFIHQHYGLTGDILGKAAARDDYAIPHALYERFLNDQRIIDALEERGVRPPVGSTAKSLPEWRTKLANQALTPIQLMVANSMLDLIDTRSQKKKLQDYNVTTATYNTWLKDAAFQSYLRERSENLLGDSQHEAHLALLDKVRMGDTKAIELFYEFQGIYTRASASAVNAQQVQFDIQNLLVSIIEIINDEVDDPAVSSRIADRFKSLMTARTIAGEVVNSAPVEPPPIAKGRVMTPELKALMDSGEGINE